MFSEKVILRKLDLFTQKFGWTPRPHSIAEVDRSSDYITSLLKTADDGGLYFDDASWTPRLIRFVQNEQAMCSLDVAYFLTRYYKISAENRFMRFQFRSGQKVFYKICQDLEERGVSIEIQCLKARKQGISTLVEGIMTHSALFIPGAKCSVGSANDQKTYVMMGMMYDALEHLPFWIKPTQTKDKRSGSAILEFAKIGTSIIIQSGSMKGGIGQGTTPTRIHLCLAPTTLIRGANGNTKPICSFDVGDYVYTGGGVRTSVKALTLSPRRHEITAELTPWGSYEAQSTTLDHPVMTEKGFVAAGNLKKGEEVLYPVRLIYKYHLDSFIYHKHTGRQSTKKPKEQRIEHSYDLGWVCGLYVAEGHLHINQRFGKESVDRITFAMHEKEVERNLAGLQRVFAGHPLKIVRRKNSKTCQIHVNSAGWARWMMERFGRVKTKHITDSVFWMGYDFCRGLLCGYLEGDGHIGGKKPEIMASTVRKTIAFQLRDLTIALGYGMPCIYNREGGVFYNRNCQEQWTLMWAGESAERMRKDFDWPARAGTKALHWRYTSDRRHIAIQLKRVERGFSENFYDLEVEHSDHTFCTAQMGMKNSECCDFTDPVTQIEEGLFKAVPSTPEIFMVLESTGNGNTGWWAEQWRTNKENYWLGKSRLLPLFLPWFMTPELFPTDHWMKKFPFPEGWTSAPETRAMTAKCEAYANNTQILSNILGSGWHLPPEQQWYWEFHYLDAKKRRTEKSWTRQMPCDDYEALIGENDSVFDWDSINNIEKRRKKTMDVFGILGEGIAEKHEPSPYAVDSKAQRYFAHWKTPREERLEWIFLPLRSEDIEQPKFDPLKKLIIYEYPEKGADYSIGCDTGTGVGGDRTIISVAKTGREADSDIQVAEFSSDDITNVEIYAWVAAIASFYGQHMDEGKTPKICIEQRRKYGDTCQHQLKLMGMNRHHEFVEYDKKTLRPKSSINGRQGWYTNAWSRPMLLGMFKYAVENGWYEVNSRWLLEEIEGFEQQMTTSGKTRMDHVTGKHDDRIFAAAMSYFCLHDLDCMVERAKKKYNAPEEEGYIVSYAPFMYQISDGAEEFFATAE